MVLQEWNLPLLNLNKLSIFPSSQKLSAPICIHLWFGLNPAQKMVSENAHRARWQKDFSALIPQNRNIDFDNHPYMRVTWRGPRNPVERPPHPDRAKSPRIENFHIHISFLLQSSSVPRENFWPVISPKGESENVVSVQLLQPLGAHPKRSTF